MYAVKHIVASGECEKYSAISTCLYVYVNTYGALIVHGILLVCDATMFTY